MYAASGGNGMAISMTMMQARNDRRGKRAELPDEIARKLKSCSVLNCEDWRDLGSYTTYHCFPTGDKNQERWEIWTQLLRKAREDDSWIPFRGSLVCSHHFRSEDFINEPSSKRRKLIKNAIPSIFPTFTVDLTDPSYQLPEDAGDNANDNADQEEYVYADPTSMVVLGDDGYEYECATEADEDEAPGDFQYAQIEDEESEDITVINDIKPPSVTRTAKQAYSVNRSSNSAGLGIVTTVGQVQVLSTASAMINQKKKSAKMNSGQIPPNQVVHFNNKNVAMQEPIPASSSSISKSQQRLTMASQLTNIRPIQPKKLNRQEEAAKALNSLPFSLNPDLEIEMVDPEEDLVACRNRISELEQENRNLTTMYENALEALKSKYEGQLRGLRRRILEQEHLLNKHDISSMPTSFVTPSSSKRSRFSYKR